MIDAQNNAGGEAKRGGHAAAYAAALVGVVFIVLFVLPGFLAAGFSQADPLYYSVNGKVVWDSEGRMLLKNASAPRLSLVRCTLLLPSDWAMEHSAAMRKFYGWEYRVARGRNDIVFDYYE